jgi:putative aldouronate transport system permease protein
MSITGLVLRKPAELRDETGRGRSRPRRSLVARIRRDRVLLLMMVPGVLYFVVFQYVAQAGNIIAFENYLPFLGFVQSQWVGFANFSAVFADPAFWAAVWHTLALAVLELIFFTPLPLLLAVLLHSLLSGRLRKFMQSVVFLPHFISWVVAIALIQDVIGPTGVIGSHLGSAAHPFNLIGDGTFFYPVMVGELIWKDCGWATIIFTAALFMIDEGLYEAAAIDGAGPWRRFWHLTLPGLRPVLILVLIMRLGGIFDTGFDQVMMQRLAFGPGVSEVIDTYVFYHATVNGQWSQAAAAGLFKSILAVFLVITANKIAHRLGEQGVYR